MAQVKEIILIHSQSHGWSWPGCVEPGHQQPWWLNWNFWNIPIITPGCLKTQNVDQKEVGTQGSVLLNCCHSEYKLWRRHGFHLLTHCCLSFLHCKLLCCYDLWLWFFCCKWLIMNHHSLIMIFCYMYQSLLRMIDKSLLPLMAIWSEPVAVYMHRNKPNITYLLTVAVYCIS